MSDTVTREDINRLEHKVDQMSQAINTLIRVEERQNNQGVRIGELEKAHMSTHTRIDATEHKILAVDKKVDQWINRGIGVWALAVTLWSIIQFVAPHLSR